MPIWSVGKSLLWKVIWCSSSFNPTSNVPWPNDRMKIGSSFIWSILSSSENRQGGIQTRPSPPLVPSIQFFMFLNLSLLTASLFFLPHLLRSPVTWSWKQLRQQSWASVILALPLLKYWCNGKTCPVLKLLGKITTNSWLFFPLFTLRTRWNSWPRVLLYQRNQQRSWRSITGATTNSWNRKNE